MILEGFLTNFGVLTEATGGVEHLRNLILELAAKGQLVAQQATEEPASALVKRIVEEHRMPPSGELLHPVVPFAIPESWVWATGALVFTFITSGSRGWAQHYSEEGPIFLRIGNLDYGTTALDLSSIQRVSPPTDVEGSRTRVQTGDILISITGDTGMIGLVPSDLGEAYINQHIALSRPARNMCPAYLAKILTAPFSLGRFQKAQRGIKNSLGLADIKKLLIPVPPLAEQERIVAKVDQLMALCDELEARQTKKRETGTKLTQSALDALTSAEGPEEFAKAWQRVADNFQVLLNTPESIGKVRKTILELAVCGKLTPQLPADGSVDDLLEEILSEQATAAKRSLSSLSTREPIFNGPSPFAIPRSWRWVHWGSLTLSTSSGWSPRCAGRPRAANEWGVLKVSAVSWSSFDPEENKALPAGVVPDENYVVRKDDFLMSRANTADLVGRSVVVTEEPHHLILSDKIVRCHFSRHVDKMFVNYFNRTSTARAHYIKHASGTSDSMKNISRDVILKVPIPLPPLAEQKRIVAKVDQLMALCDTLESKLRDAEQGAQRLVEAMVAEMVA